MAVGGAGSAHAGVLALFVVFAAASVTLLVFIIDAARRSSIVEGFEDVLENKWAIAALFDLVIGFVFASFQIACRASVAQQAVRAAPLIFAVWVLGSPVVLAWCAWLIVTPRSGAWDVHRALCPIPAPGSADADEESGPLTDTSSSHCGQASSGAGETIIGGFWFICGVAFLATCLTAVFDQSFAAGLAYASEHRWVLVTWIDVLVGLLFTATYITVRETRGGTGGWVSAAAWLVALALLGNGATAAYAAWIARQAYASSRSFRSCLLSQKPL